MFMFVVLFVLVVGKLKTTNINKIVSKINCKIRTNTRTNVNNKHE